jgi:hypothetical protein
MVQKKNLATYEVVKFFFHNMVQKNLATYKHITCVVLLTPYFLVFETAIFNDHRNPSPLNNFSW